MPPVPAAKPKDIATPGPDVSAITAERDAATLAHTKAVDAAAKADRQHKADMAERDRRIEQLLAAQDARNATADDDTPEELGCYLVTAVGIGYALPTDPTHILLGLQGRVVEMGASEAERLLYQEAIRAATDEDIAREAGRARQAAVDDARGLEGPAGNPYGGMVSGTTLEKHAAAQIALAQKAGATAGATA